MTNLNPNSIPDGGVGYKHISKEVTDNIKDAVVDSINSRLVPDAPSPTQVLYHVNGGTPQWVTSFAIQPTQGSVTNDAHILFLNAVTGDIYWRGRAVINISGILSSIGTISNLAVSATNLVDAINIVFNSIGTGSGGGTTTITDSTIVPFNGFMTSTQISAIVNNSSTSAATSVMFNNSDKRFYGLVGRNYYPNWSNSTKYNTGTDSTSYARTNVVYSYGGKHYIHLLNVGLVSIDNIQTYVDNKCLEVRTTASEEDRLLRSRINTLESNLQLTNENILSLDLSIGTELNNLRSSIEALNTRLNNLNNSISTLGSLVTDLRTRLITLEQFNSNSLDARINAIISERIKYLTSEDAYNSLTNIKDDVLYVIKDK